MTTLETLILLHSKHRESDEVEVKCCIPATEDRDEDAEKTEEETDLVLDKGRRFHMPCSFSTSTTTFLLWETERIVGRGVKLEPIATAR